MDHTHFSPLDKTFGHPCCYTIGPYHSAWSVLCLSRLVFSIYTLKQIYSIYVWFHSLVIKPTCVKILFRKEGERYGKLYTTGRHYIDFPMPETGDYVIEIRARCEGGDGPISQIRVQGETKLDFAIFRLLLSFFLCLDLSLFHAFNAAVTSCICNRIQLNLTGCCS